MSPLGVGVRGLIAGDVVTVRDGQGREQQHVVVAIERISSPVGPRIQLWLAAQPAIRVEEGAEVWAQRRGIEVARFSVPEVLAALLGLTRLTLGAHADAPSVTGLWTVELTSQAQPAVAIGVAHQGGRCRAALAVMPDDPFLPLPSRTMIGDDVVIAAEKQLRYVPLLEPSATRDACSLPIRYGVQSWTEARSASVSFVSPSRGPLRTLATTLHQLVDHVARKTGALDSVRFLSSHLSVEDLAAE